MSSEDYACPKCLETVAEGARKCPHCGYAAHSKSAVSFGSRFVAAWCKLAKWVCYVTIIGIPIGLLFRRWERKYTVSQDQTIAEPRDELAA